MIAIEHLTKRIGETTLVDDVSMVVDTGTITVVVGTSGAGKSTLLRMINRLITPTSGRVLIDGQDTMDIPEDRLRHRIGYVIQGNGLFPHRTVAGNIATVPRLLGWDQKRIRRRVEELLDLFQLDPAEFANKFPRHLSGGQQQRVGVARALAAEPRLLLMDEPFGALDPIIRGKAQADLIAIQRRFGTTIVLVTHDMEEAFHLGDRIAVMNDAQLLQYDTPAQLLTRPAAGFVERLVGSSDRPFRLLSLAKVRDAMEPGDAPGEPIDPDVNLRDALSRLIWAGADRLPVAHGNDTATAHISVSGILSHGRPPQ
ncbi:ABC transporter ATP-binding protein [Chelatococcus asaccharovorans]|uniref:Osmoprotectant transport system ATP-binding protein n=1 Tax=Chelatococcus asaccharovorans TaxID=28210 RepID=A0A2V3U0J2_9HYPH|nr:ABC transporter ATP-binding protein [Chelatococcus asaccharovorans]MBS7707792.1 ABC transporter ATP-binding protein [Chelatococcus asaccharovorans]PXW55089.1 osmoprotectant transport system ATP-binding protein [Chelatococcus asaccharovorans]CAH1657941.1 glycine betaine ABC transporter ATP binding subunit YehX [Chelatococcus asaccharovorans]CAH1688933.1 glycine betaine ABC transporter ATP binding subunit YehX [Chelatococcus asaccharovorans]